MKNQNEITIRLAVKDKVHMLTLAKRERASCLQTIWRLRDAGIDATAATAELRDLEALIATLEAQW